MRCRAGLGQGPTALPAPTSRILPVVSACLLSVRVALRYQPFAPFPRILRQGRGSADGPYPVRPACQDVTGVTLTAPPLRIASPCFFLLHCLMNILIVSKSLGPNAPTWTPPVVQGWLRQWVTEIGLRAYIRPVAEHYGSGPDGHACTRAPSAQRSQSGPGALSGSPSGGLSRLPSRRFSSQPVVSRATSSIVRTPLYIMKRSYAAN